jgi:hypothetical protein
MDIILEFFEPVNGLDIWIRKFVLVSIISYLVVWGLALIFCWGGWKVGGSEQLRVWFAWMIPLILHLSLSGALIVFTAIHFKQLDISLGYSLPFIVLILISGNWAYTLNRKVKERLKRLERRIKE